MYLTYKSKDIALGNRTKVFDFTLHDKGFSMNRKIWCTSSELLRNIFLRCQIYFYSLHMVKTASEMISTSIYRVSVSVYRTPGPKISVLLGISSYSSDNGVYLSYVSVSLLRGDFFLYFCQTISLTKYLNINWIIASPLIR